MGRKTSLSVPQILKGPKQVQNFKGKRVNKNYTEILDQQLHGAINQTIQLKDWQKGLDPLAPTPHWSPKPFIQDWV